MVGAMGLVSRPTSNPPVCAVNQAYVLGEGDQGIYRVESGEPVGERMMTGMRLRGGVGGLLSGMTGEVSSERISPPSYSLMKSSIGIGQRGMGATILGGCCWSGMPLGSV